MPNRAFRSLHWNGCVTRTTPWCTTSPAASSTVDRGTSLIGSPAASARVTASWTRLVEVGPLLHQKFYSPEYRHAAPRPRVAPSHHVVGALTAANLALGLLAARSFAWTVRRLCPGRSFAAGGDPAFQARRRRAPRPDAGTLLDP